MAEKRDSEQKSLNTIMSERGEKGKALAACGRNPYANGFVPSHSIGEVRKKYESTKPEEHKPGMKPVDGEVLALAGRVVAKRGFGKTMFVPIRDTNAQIQLFINIDHLDAKDFEEVKPRLDVGDIVSAEGAVFWTKRGEMSVLVKKLSILTKSLRPLPDKWHGLTNVETRYRQRYLDLAVNAEVRDVFVKRSRMIKLIREKLDSNGFLEVETPMMHPTIGGAAARPFKTHHNALDMQLYMRIAPELYLKRLVVGGFERVYEINRNFRNEGLSRQHNPEFTMLEFYQAYATYEDLMDFTESLVAELAQELNGQSTVNWLGHEIELAAPWKRLSVRDSIVEIGGVDRKALDSPLEMTKVALESGIRPDDIARALLGGLSLEDVEKRTVGMDSPGAALKDDTETTVNSFIQSRDELDIRERIGHLAYLVFEARVEEKLIQPTFITEFPLAVSPLARKKESDPAFVDRFELFVGGKEIANAFSELNDPIDQRSRFQAQLDAKAQGADETMDYDEDYCQALELGMPPAAGEGIGIDRLAMLLCGQDSIRDVILFPLMRPDKS